MNADQSASNFGFQYTGSFTPPHVVAGTSAMTQCGVTVLTSPSPAAAKSRLTVSPASTKGFKFSSTFEKSNEPFDFSTSDQTTTALAPHSVGSLPIACFLNKFNARCASTE